LESHELASLIADVLDEKKASDISLLDVGDLLQICEVFVIASGGSRRQVLTLAEEVEARAEERDRRALRVEGREDAEWVLIDFGDVVVHVFQPPTRDFYSLERLWGDAPRLQWEPATSDTA